jgi:AcrR family transcriptional regulator
VRRAVLETVLTELLAGGYDALSIGDVATKSGVHESTIYRRWGTKPELVADALLEFAAREVPTPDTGSLEDDLRQLLGEVVALLRRPEFARIVRTVAALPPEITGATPVRRAFWSTRFERSGEVVRRAIARGELAADTDPEELQELLVGPTYLRLLLTDRPLDETLVERSVRSVLDAYRRR